MNRNVRVGSLTWLGHGLQTRVMGVQIPPHPISIQLLLNPNMVGGCHEELDWDSDAIVLHRGSVG